MSIFYDKKYLSSRNYDQFRYHNFLEYQMAILSKSEDKTNNYSFFQYQILFMQWIDNFVLFVTERPFILKQGKHFWESICFLILAMYFPDVTKLVIKPMSGTWDWTDGQMDGQLLGCYKTAVSHTGTDRWMNRWPHTWMDGRMDGQTDRQRDRQTNCDTNRQSTTPSMTKFWWAGSESPIVFCANHLIFCLFFRLSIHLSVHPSLFASVL